VGVVAIAGVSGRDLDDDGGDPLAVADGAYFTGDAINRLYAGGSREIAIRFAPGADREAVTRRIADQRTADGGPQYEVNGPATPLEVRRLQQVDALPFVLAAFLALLGIVAVGFALASSVRRRGRDLAILKTLGFSRRQVSATVAWQATTIALVGLLVGIPLGVVAGTAVWRMVADDIGVVSVPEIPIALLIGIAAATLVLANLIAAVPAWVAARTQPARVLRSE
jgi:predicted lysophospholipase L1 biosynthesis ABC-type transport system permease subunit